MGVVAELRTAALARAASMRDPRVAEVIRRAIADVRERAGEGWESSDGTVRAIDVRLIVDGHALGLVESSPAVRDAVIEAVSGVAPSAVGASVVELAIGWGLRERRPEAGYRGDGPERADAEDDDDVRRAIVGYLAAIGDDEGARAVDGCELRVGVREAYCDAPIDASRIEPALRAILGRAVRVVADR